MFQFIFGNQMNTNIATLLLTFLFQIGNKNRDKIFIGDKIISYSIIVFHVTKGRKMIKLERCKLVMSLSKKRTL